MRPYLADFVINAGSGSGIAAVSLQNIQNREEEHPDDVNEVPIQTCAVKKTVLPRGDFPHERPDQCSDEQDHTDQNVKTVKTGQHEEARAHDTGSVEPEPLTTETGPLKSLIGQKRGTQKDRKQQQKFATFASLD